MLFAVGILVTIAAIGAITAVAGRMMGDVGRYGNYVVAVIFFVVGLHLVGVIPLSLSGAGQVGMKRKGYLAAFILGLVFGIALGPCTFAYMASTQLVQRFLNWNANSMGLTVVKIACGILVILGGVWLIYTAP